MGEAGVESETVAGLGRGRGRVYEWAMVRVARGPTCRWS